MSWIDGRIAANQRISIGQVAGALTLLADRLEARAGQ